MHYSLERMEDAFSRLWVNATSNYLCILEDGPRKHVLILYILHFEARPGN